MENSYFWSPAHFFFNNNKSYIYGSIEEAVHVQLQVTDPYGCIGMDSLLLNPQECCTISMPTAFTPNNDGKNDYFHPLSAGYHRFHIFRVVNRWGQTVYETTEINQGWDGQLNGEPQDMDVYYYYLKYDCGGGMKEKTGEVTLVR
jgi:gliding motility-associated-like protein